MRGRPNARGVAAGAAIDRPVDPVDGAGETTEERVVGSLGDLTPVREENSVPALLLGGGGTVAAGGPLAGAKEDRLLGGGGREDIVVEAVGDLGRGAFFSGAPEVDLERAEVDLERGVGFKGAEVEALLVGAGFAVPRYTWLWLNESIHADRPHTPCQR